MSGSAPRAPWHRILQRDGGRLELVAGRGRRAAVAPGPGALVAPLVPDPAVPAWGTTACEACALASSGSGASPPAPAGRLGSTVLERGRSASAPACRPLPSGPDGLGSPGPPVAPPAGRGPRRGNGGAMFAPEGGPGPLGRPRSCAPPSWSSPGLGGASGPGGTDLCPRWAALTPVAGGPATSGSREASWKGSEACPWSETAAMKAWTRLGASGAKGPTGSGAPTCRARSLRCQQAESRAKVALTGLAVKMFCPSTGAPGSALVIQYAASPSRSPVLRVSCSSVVRRRSRRTGRIVAQIATARKEFHASSSGDEAGCAGLIPVGEATTRVPSACIPPANKATQLGSSEQSTKCPCGAGTPRLSGSCALEPGGAEAVPGGGRMPAGAGWARGATATGSGWGQSGGGPSRTGLWHPGQMPLGGSGERNENILPPMKQLRQWCVGAGLLGPTPLGAVAAVGSARPGGLRSTPPSLIPVPAGRLAAAPGGRAAPGSGAG